MKKILLVSIIFMLKSLFAVEVALETNSRNLSKLSNTSKVYFGEAIFKGNFKENKQFRYNPDYLINVGDVISIKLWGAYEYTDEVIVDKQGNIFIPKIGDIPLLGLSNGLLTDSIENRVKSIFNSNVHVYADVKQYQPISVFVSGSVHKIGLYKGLSTDSILQFIDKAGGIIRGQGSYRNISILRNKEIIKELDLYPFLLNGQVDMFQFQNGDTILVNSVKNYIEVEGEVSRPYTFELLVENTSVQDIMRYIMPKPTANSFMLTSWQNNSETTKEYPLNQASSIQVSNGSKLKFFSNHYVNSIEIEVEGEHKGAKNISVKKGTTLYDLLAKLKFTELSDIKNVKIYRKSVAEIQKQLIETMLSDLEARVFTSDSATIEEASIRKKESEMVLKFVERVRKIEPKGQVVIGTEDNLDKIYLEAGDRIIVPKRSNIVVVQGEVNIPNALAYKKGYSLTDYIRICGGYGDRANKEKILLIKANGEVKQYASEKESFFSVPSLSPKVEPGDSILVLGKVDSKNILITSSVTKILYQLAVGAAVVLRAF